jgi:hypothetical protein
MNFNHWAGERGKGIMEAPRVMSECSSVDDDGIYSPTSAMNGID